MKRFISILIIFLMTTSAFAEDLSSMTNEELLKLRTQIDMELTERKAHEDDQTIIFENGDILLYSAGTGSSWSDGYHMTVVFMNKSPQKIGLMFDYVIINGWQFDVYDISSTIEPGKKTKMDVTLDHVSAELNNVTEIKEIGFKFKSFTDNYESNAYDIVYFVPVW